MATNSELSDIKLLLQSLISGLEAVKADVAELKKNQSQNQHSNNSTCASCADALPGSSIVEKALSDTEASLMAKIRDTESAVLELVEEEKVLIRAEVVQLSRTVGAALEDAKGKMMAKVAEVVEAANDNKRRRSTADVDGDDGEDGGGAKKRIKQGEEDDDGGAAKKRIKQKQEESEEEEEEEEEEEKEYPNKDEPGKAEIYEEMFGPGWQETLMHWENSTNGREPDQHVSDPVNFVARMRKLQL